MSFLLNRKAMSKSVLGYIILTLLVILVLFSGYLKLTSSSEKLVSIVEVEQCEKNTYFCDFGCSEQAHALNKCSDEEFAQGELWRLYFKQCDDSEISEEKKESLKCDGKAHNAYIDHLGFESMDSRDKQFAHIKSESKDSRDSTISSIIENYIFEGKTKESEENKKLFSSVDFNLVKEFGIFEKHGSITPKRILLHHTGGDSKESAIIAMLNFKLGVHFILDKDGTVYQYANLNDKMWHAGPANSDSIGIEIVNNGYSSYTDAQYRSLGKLSEFLKNGLKLEGKYLAGHFEVIDIYGSGTAGKWDPHPNFDWSRIGYPRESEVAYLKSFCDRVLNDKNLNYNLNCYVPKQIS